MRTLSKNIFLVGASLFLIVFAFYGFDSNLFNNIKVQVESIGTPSDREQFNIIKNEIFSDIKFLNKESLWDIDISKVIAEIKRKNWIEDVQLTRLFPNRLEIGVALKKVEVVYVDDAGIWMPVAGDGTMLAKNSKSLIPDVPYLRGRRFYDNKELRKSAIEFLHLFPNSGNLTANQISEVYYEPKSGFEVLLAKTGTRVIFGQEALELKLRRVGKVLEYLEAKEIHGRVIDARFEKKILVRMRKRT
ncbi:MAG: hypothetical protein A4S09_16040 [Proteobacteria bacterium SG_bin7]|nr:MAG: hypothetical protein A4S09_16040 [Proteobacteria bacterium SG_bin7]